MNRSAAESSNPMESSAGSPIVAFHSRLLECYDDRKPFDDCNGLQIQCLLQRAKHLGAVLGERVRGRQIQNVQFRACIAYFTRQFLANGDPNKKNWPILGGRHDDLADSYAIRQREDLRGTRPIMLKAKDWLRKHMGENEASKAMNEHSQLGNLLLVHGIQELWNDTHLSKMVTSQRDDEKEHFDSKLKDGIACVEAVTCWSSNDNVDMDCLKTIDYNDLPHPKKTEGKELLVMDDGTGTGLLLL